MERLFVAMWPPADVVDAVAAIELGDGVRRVRPERLHVTLRFLGDVNPGEVSAALDRVALPAATATFGGRILVLGRDAVVVPVGGFDGLAGVVADATGSPPAPFVGHLTIGRVRQRARPAVTVPMHSFAVTHVDLVRSVLGRDGPTYTTLRTWPVGRS